jgi:hypothetical protein
LGHVVGYDARVVRTPLVYTACMPEAARTADVFPPLADHDVIRLGGQAAVIVPVEEFTRLRQAALHTRFLRAQAAGETSRMTVEEFIDSSDLPETEKQRLRDVPITRAAQG